MMICIKITNLILHKQKKLIVKDFRTRETLVSRYGIKITNIYPFYRNSQVFKYIMYIGILNLLYNYDKITEYNKLQVTIIEIGFLYNINIKKKKKRKLYIQYPTFYIIKEYYACRYT